jgi:hypothetical protein
MSERIVDDFSRKLASGMSRRKAFWQLLAGAGGLALLATQKASATAANNNADCTQSCFNQTSIAFTQCIEDGLETATPFITILTGCLSSEGLVYDACLATSRTCSPGKCAQVKFTVNPGEIDIISVACVGLA